MQNANYGNRFVFFAFCIFHFELRVSSYFPWTEKARSTFPGMPPAVG